MSDELEEPTVKRHDDGRLEIVNRDRCLDVFPCAIDALDLMVRDYNEVSSDLLAARAVITDLEAGTTGAVLSHEKAVAMLNAANTERDALAARIEAARAYCDRYSLADLRAILDGAALVGATEPAAAAGSESENRGLGDPEATP